MPQETKDQKGYKLSYRLKAPHPFDAIAAHYWLRKEMIDKFMKCFGDKANAPGD